ncbi:MAG: NifB/NifX family molybdenum-iron cluster-binding protein [Opitutaceae bacterium]
MIIALPLTENNEFSSHFGASAKAGLFEVDPAVRDIVRVTVVMPPEPEPCGWPDWLGALGVKLFLAGGMGRGAQQRMAGAGIKVIVGVPAAHPRDLVQAWLDGKLALGDNTCEGGHHGDGHPHDCDQHNDHHHAGGCNCSH